MSNVRPLHVFISLVPLSSIVLVNKVVLVCSHTISWVFLVYYKLFLFSITFLMHFIKATVILAFCLCKWRDIWSCNGKLWQAFVLGPYPCVPCKLPLGDIYWLYYICSPDSLLTSDINCNRERPVQDELCTVMTTTVN